MEYRKKPVVIEAIQYTGNNGGELNLWSMGEVVQSPVLEPTTANPTGAYVQIKTLEGVMIGVVGDWIIKGIKGEFYPCKPDIFEATYEPARLVSPEREALEKIREKIGDEDNESFWDNWNHFNWDEQIEFLEEIRAIATQALEAGK